MRTTAGQLTGIYPSPGDDSGITDPLVCSRDPTGVLSCTATGYDPGTSDTFFVDTQYNLGIFFGSSYDVGTFATSTLSVVCV